MLRIRVWSYCVPTKLLWISMVATVTLLGLSQLSDVSIIQLANLNLW